ASRRRQPDRRVPAARADLEHLAVRLRGADGEEKATGRRCDRNTGGTWLLGLEPLEHRPHQVVEHQRTSTLIIPSSTRTGKVLTGCTAGSVRARPLRMSMFAPCRGQIATPSSQSKSPSQSGPSSCEQRSSSAKYSPPRL